MDRPLQGRYVETAAGGEVVRAFLPAPLPPQPPIEWSPALRRRFDDALHGLGRLDGIAATLPNPALLLYGFVRKEAVLSSRIEGTQSSLDDLLLYEVDAEPGVPIEDVREVSLYVAALEHGLARVRAGFPLSIRLLREVHEVLMGRGRGSRRAPGEIRRSQNWIGGTRPGNAVFVPPPPQAVPDCLGALERFLHDAPEPAPTLVKAALSHVQFETIHPFLDGNGRVGRLLITLLLCAEGVLREPLLFPSLYFKEHRQTYYDLLNGVRLRGNWEAWLEFFAEAVTASANAAIDTSDRLAKLVVKDRIRIEALGRAARSALAVHAALSRSPIGTAGSLVKATGLSAATVNKALLHLERLHIVSEVTKRQRDRVWSYRRYAAILGEGTATPAGAAG